MLVTAYNFTLNHSLLQGLVTINKFDGVNPALASWTTGGKILVHTPHTGVLKNDPRCEKKSNV